MRKIILSRKGYDDQYGGKPSAILPDGTMLSFPIPVETGEEGIATELLTFSGQKLVDIFHQLEHKQGSKTHHVDPDLYGLAGNTSLGAFGQGGAALGHLNNQQVDEGDVFLFFGTFCPIIETSTGYQYEKMHPFHAIYGYLEVDKKVSVIDIDENQDFHGLKNHPHYINRDFGEYKKANAIYIGKNYGYFRFAENLRLTKPGYKKTWWQLPEAFADAKISYHESAEKIIHGDFVEFQSVAKGQEFVIESSPSLEKWLSNILKNKIEK